MYTGPSLVAGRIHTTHTHHKTHSHTVGDRRTHDHICGGLPSNSVFKLAGPTRATQGWLFFLLYLVCYAHDIHDFPRPCGRPSGETD